MGEKLENAGRRDFMKRVGGAAGAVALAGAPLLRVTEALAEQRLDKYSVHEVPKGTPAPVDLLLELDVPYPRDWREKLGGKDTGVIISKKWHRMWFFQDGKLVTDDQGRPFPIGSANTERTHERNKTSTYSTRSGLFHVGRHSPKHMSSLYGRGRRGTRSFVGAPMYNAMFLADSGGNDNAEALHGSGNFYIDKDGTLMVRVDNSHGCVNGYRPQVKRIYKEFLKHKRDFPVYILNDDEEWEPDNRPSPEDADKELLQQIVYAEQEVKAAGKLAPLQNDQHKKFCNLILPKVPDYDDLIKGVARQIYGNLEHYAANDPIVKLLSKSRGLHGNATRIDASRLLTVIRQAGIVLSNRKTETALATGKYKYLEVQHLTNSSEAQLHGSWATAFGYTRIDDVWVPVRAAGLLLQTEQGLMLITKDDDALEQGMPIYARINGVFEFAGVARGESKQSDGLHMHTLLGSTQLRSVID